MEYIQKGLGKYLLGHHHAIIPKNEKVIETEKGLINAVPILNFTIFLVFKLLKFRGFI